MAEFEYSKYFSDLKEADAKKRYEEKMKIADCIKDPYCYLESKNISSSIEWSEWPDVMFADIYNYLVVTISLYTREQLKAYKSLDGYNFFTNGWVKSVTVLTSGKQKNYLFLAVVKHSQSLSVSPLKVWIAIKGDGEVLCAHCTCMAGLGEACSHVAAVLFAAEANSITKRQFSSTSLPCSWLPPTFQSVEFAEVHNIDFTTPKHKRKLSVQPCDDTSKKRKIEILQPTEDNINSYYLKLSKLKVKPVLLSLISGFNDAYVPKYVSGILPKPLTYLYDEEALSMSFPDLLRKCDEIYDTVSISVEQASAVEQETRKQSDSKVWFEQRAGRVTASKLYSVLHTNQSQPSVSLIKSICYPEAVRFFSNACTYGCKHEDDARSIYTERMKMDHSSFSVKSSGLLLDPSNPFIGASPDGIVDCNCCGIGVLEIKCPYSCKDKAFEQRAEEQSFFLENVNGDLVLKKNHAYYYQIQLQMKLYGGVYCDFVVWRKDNTIRQRIPLDVHFITESVAKIPSFIKSCILPELVGKWFTKPTEPSSDPGTADILDDPEESHSSDTVHNVTADVDDFEEHTCSTSTHIDNGFIDFASQVVGDSLTVIDSRPVDTDIADDTANTSIADTTCNQQETGHVSDNAQQGTSHISDNASASVPTSALWCYCQQDKPEESMVGCDNPTCRIEWFHLSCLRLTVGQLPKGKWFCPDCHKSRPRSKKKTNK